MSSEAKVKLLQSNEDWRERYEDLVKSGLVNDSLFWSDKRGAIDACQAYLNMQGQSTGQPKESAQQRAAAVLRRIRGVTDGRGEVKFRLTTEIISAIYSNLPRVKELHDEFVGTKLLTEKDFWTQFCTSKTFGKELGVGEEFIGKEGNVFDRAFEELKEYNLPEEETEDATLKFATPNPLVDISRNEENELVERGRDSKPTLKAIKQLNIHSLQALHDIPSCEWSIDKLVDISDLHSQAILDEECSDLPSSSEEREQRDGAKWREYKYEPETFANMQLLPFAEFKVKVLGQPSTDGTQQFTSITPADFSENHFEITQRLYKNIMHLLRLFWRLQPMNTPEKQSQCIIIFGAVDQLTSRFAGHPWPAEEKGNAESLLSACFECIDAARHRMSSKR